MKPKHFLKYNFLIEDEPIESADEDAKREKCLNKVREFS